MSDGLTSALGRPYTIHSTGDGLSQVPPVMPGDKQWLSKLPVWPWDESTEDGGNKVPNPKFWNACECGADKTPNPNLHSRWCPKFVDPMGRNK